MVCKNKFWITYEELLDRWGISESELLIYLKKDVPIYYLTGKTIPSKTANTFIGEYLWMIEMKSLGQAVNEIRLKEYHQMFRQWKLKQSDILKLEQKRHMQEIEQEKTVFPCQPGTTWEDVTMILVAKNMLRIKTPQKEGLFTYHQLGLNDKRQGDRPTMLWSLLMLFAKSQGFISPKNTNYDPKLIDTAKRLDAHLRKIFAIDERIYQGHYKKEKGYRTRIKFEDRTFSA
jgi:hypothetical protein